MPALTLVEAFLVAMAMIFALPYAVWRLVGGDRWLPLVVVQILAGIVLGPAVLGAAWPAFHATVFPPPVIQALNGIAWWSVMLFVWLAGIELDLGDAWRHRRECGITAGVALLLPFAAGAVVAAGLLAHGGWVGPKATPVQFVAGIGMACAVTALPILVLLMDQLGILRQALGQRILRYASLDDLAVWAMLAAILMDWARLGRQAVFLLAFALAARALQHVIPRLAMRDRWALSLVWLIVVALGADWAGLHFMVGAFLAGAVMHARWFDQRHLDQLREHVLMIGMPVFFLSSGLRTEWQMGGLVVLAAALALLVAAVGGKLAGTALAGRWLGWAPGEAWAIGWLLQTKALIMIIFANVLLDMGLIAPEAFTALLLMALASTALTLPMLRLRVSGVAAPRTPA
ncbi:MAG: cation:proton antiporter [Burkholderiaceae bacterium]|nr:cation:proton antiporter [Burkholderiaceae bacterium]